VKAFRRLFVLLVVLPAALLWELAREVWREGICGGESEPG
jgi:hypothetical protein